MTGPEIRAMPDPIDPALRNQPEIVPSPVFAHRVMRAVRHQAADRRGLRFPWHLAGSGLVVAAALTAAALAGSPPAPIAATPPPGWLAAAVAGLATTLAGSLGLAWCSVRLARRW